MIVRDGMTNGLRKSAVTPPLCMVCAGPFVLLTRSAHSPMTPARAIKV